MNMLDICMDGVIQILDQNYAAMLHSPYGHRVCESAGDGDGDFKVDEMICDGCGQTFDAADLEICGDQWYCTICTGCRGER